MIYLLTYTTIDNEFGNPFWHACILLSKFDETDPTSLHKVQVDETWGFYGIPSTDRLGCLSKLKINIGLDIDFVGNHGMLRHEDIRYLDLGRALHGITFELNEAQWVALKNKCKKVYEDQQAAINEITKLYGLEAKENYKIYSHEQHSQLIHHIEKTKAAEEGRQPRLKPFEVKLNMTLAGPTLRHSHTCKSQILELLKETLSKEQIDSLTEYNKHPTVPKYSGEREKIQLHSEGILHTHRKSSGEIVHYRDSKDEGTKLFWTLPPQLFNTNHTQAKKIFSIDKELLEPIKNVIKKLQAIEWILINAIIPEYLIKHKHELIQMTKYYYEAFAVIDIKKYKTTTSVNLFNFFSHNTHDEKNNTYCALKNAESFLNSLYFSIVDQWEIESIAPPESESISVETIAAYLSEKDKIAICNILKRTYDPLPKIQMNMTAADSSCIVS